MWIASVSPACFPFDCQSPRKRTAPLQTGTSGSRIRPARSSTLMKNLGKSSFHFIGGLAWTGASTGFTAAVPGGGAGGNSGDGGTYQARTYHGLHHCTNVVASLARGRGSWWATVPWCPPVSVVPATSRTSTKPHGTGRQWGKSGSGACPRLAAGKQREYPY